MSTRHRPRMRSSSDDDLAFDEALAHISLLATRLQSIRALHRPRSTLLGGPRCADCGRRYPCPTLICVSDSRRQKPNADTAR